MIKRLLSYILPIKIYESKSEISQALEVTWNNGKLVLDSKNTNYSYGSLQKVLRKGLITIGFEKINAMNEILILGVAGGSVIKTLVDEVLFKGSITGVEIDERVIKLSNDYFGLNQIKNYTPILADAKEFVSNTSKKYNLIIIDIFEDNKMPDFLFEKRFVDCCKQILQENGCILFNTMILDSNKNDRNSSFLELFEPTKYNVKTISNVEEFNELILINCLL